MWWWLYQVHSYCALCSHLPIFLYLNLEFSTWIEQPNGRKWSICCVWVILVNIDIRINSCCILGVRFRLWLAIFGIYSTILNLSANVTFRLSYAIAAIYLYKAQSWFHHGVLFALSTHEVLHNMVVINFLSFIGIFQNPCDSTYSIFHAHSCTLFSIVKFRIYLSVSWHYFIPWLYPSDLWFSRQSIS